MTDKLMEIVRLYGEGLRQEAITARLGFRSQSSVSKLLKANGLSQRKVTSMLRAGLTPERIVASVCPQEQTPPPLDLAEKLRAANAEVERLEGVISSWIAELESGVASLKACLAGKSCD